MVGIHRHHQVSGGNKQRLVVVGGSAASLLVPDSRSVRVKGRAAIDQKRHTQGVVGCRDIRGQRVGSLFDRERKTKVEIRTSPMLDWFKEMKHKLTTKNSSSAKSSRRWRASKRVDWKRCRWGGSMAMLDEEKRGKGNEISNSLLSGGGGHTNGEVGERRYRHGKWQIGDGKTTKTKLYTVWRLRMM